MKVDREKPWYAPLVSSFLLTDVPQALGLSPEAFARDVHTCERRLSSEGESFLTKTLPSLGKAFDLALQGLSPLQADGFKKSPRRSALPAFLQALTRRVFSDGGWVVANPDPNAIRLFRQICYWFKKVEKGFTDESIRIACADLIEVDQALPSVDQSSNPRVLPRARAVIDSVFGRKFRISECYPAHGPGAVADGDDVVGKRCLTHRYSDLEALFRPVPFFMSYHEYIRDPQTYLDGPICQHGLSRTEFVEKDSSGPRVIGLEPAEYMWCQQALKRWMYNHIESHRITRGQVNFTDQTVNQKLTRDWQTYDTLDMSKASDRNSLSLVEYLFCNTGILPYLKACRTPGTRLPNGELLWFKKFAPMGSAVCFPVQAMVYYALACASLANAGVPLLLALRSVFVYGDDLVVPTGYFARINADFESVGLKFNMNKCCIAGKFRESCGVDAYDGVNVTPVRFKRPYPKHGSAVDLIPIVKHANQLMVMGYWHSALHLREMAECVYSDLFRKYPLPTSPRVDLPFLYWIGIQNTVHYRYNRNTSMTTVRGWTFRPLTKPDTVGCEKKHYRESLSRGGPVGHLTPGQQLRLFDVRYSGKLVKCKLFVQPEGPMIWDCVGQKPMVAKPV